MGKAYEDNETRKLFVIGAGIVVAHGVPPFSIVTGNPAKNIKSFQNIHDFKSYIESKQKTIP